jgi:hypothetical protein
VNIYKTKTGSAKTIVALVITLVIIGAVAYLGISFGSLAAIGDAIAGANYEPSAEMAEIIERDNLTKAGERILRATKPELESADSFNQHCYSGTEHESSVLGCYSSDRIYVYDIDNAELNGIKETVLAHELLHAVWNRMGNSQRSNLYADLETTYRSHLDELGGHMAMYSESEYYDELHSIIGSQLEASDMTENLRQHYAKYFTDQGKIVNYYNAYNTKFTALEKRAETLKTEIDNNRAKVDNLTTAYNVEYDSLVAAVDDFNARASRTNGFASRAQFDAERAQLVARQEKLDASYRELSSLIDATNLLVEEYNSNVTQIGDLYDSVNSRIEKPNSLIEE